MANADDDYEDWWIGDYLPSIYEVATTIHHYAKTYGSQKRRTAIHKYSLAVQKLWTESFTESHVVSLTVVKRRIENIMDDYEKRVFVRAKTGHFTVRRGNKLWMAMDVPQSKRGPRRMSCKNSDLFDIGKDTDKLEGREKIFYNDQCHERRHRLSQEIDTEYEEEQLELQRANKKRRNDYEMKSITSTRTLRSLHYQLLELLQLRELSLSTNLVKQISMLLQLSG